MDIMVFGDICHSTLWQSEYSLLLRAEVFACFVVGVVWVAWIEVVLVVVLDVISSWL